MTMFRGNNNGILGVVVLTIIGLWIVRMAFGAFVIWHYDRPHNTAAAAAAINRLSSPPASVTNHATTNTKTGGKPMSKSQLTLMVNDNTLHVRWICTNDSSGTWDYICRQPQLRETWGYNVDSSKITSSSELMYAGRSLVP